MCSPMLAITGGSAVLGAVGAQQNADATASAASANYNNQTIAFREQQSQVNQEAAQAVNNRYTQMLQQEGRLNAIAGEAGIAGGSVNDNLQATDMNASQDMTSIQKNNQWKQQQIQRQQAGAYAQTASTINQASSKANQALFSSGLQIAGAGADYYDKTHP